MKDQGILYIGGAIIAILLTTSIIGFVSNSKNKRNLNAEQIESETLAAEKQQLQYEIDNLRTDQTALTGRYDSAQVSLADAETRIKERERRISVLSRGNTALEEDRRLLSELQTEKADLDKTYSNLQQQYEQALAENKQLQTSLGNLESQHEDVSTSYERSEIFTSDNFETYGSRGKNKEKLTVWACRTKKLNANFEVPQSLNDSITFRIITPSGTVINPGENLSWRFMEDENLTAGLGVAGVIEKPRKVSIYYEATERLSKGEYKIEILSNNMNIGNTRLRLR